MKAGATCCSCASRLAPDRSQWPGTARSSTVGRPLTDRDRVQNPLPPMGAPPAARDGSFGAVVSAVSRRAFEHAAALNKQAPINGLVRDLHVGIIRERACAASRRFAAATNLPRAAPPPACAAAAASPNGSAWAFAPAPTRADRPSRARYCRRAPMARDLAADRRCRSMQSGRAIAVNDSPACQAARNLFA